MHAVTQRHLARLSVILALVLASHLSLMVPWPTVAQEATPASPPVGTPAPFVGETFVGMTSDPDTFVAVVVAEPVGTGGERQAQAYLCNATTIDAWLLGTLAGDRLDLRAEDGTRVEATRGDEWVEGTVTLGDGRVLTIITRPATRIAGLYSVTIDAEGRLRGISTTKGELAGRIEAEGGVPAGMPTLGFRLLMTVTTLAGESTEIEARATVAEEGSFWLIVLGDGQVRGRGTTKDGQESIDPISNLSRHPMCLEPRCWAWRGAQILEERQRVKREPRRARRTG